MLHWKTTYKQKKNNEGNTEGEVGIVVVGYPLQSPHVECVLDLLVEIVAVRDDDDPWVLDAALESERAPKHHHRQ